MEKMGAFSLAQLVRMVMDLDAMDSDAPGYGGAR